MPNDAACARLYASRYVRSYRPRLHVRVAPIAHPQEADMRRCYDAITPTNIPTNAQMVAGYVDGKYAWTAAEWARFPHAVKVRIAVFSSTNDGHVLDVEPGCSTAANAPGWVVRRRKAGIDPTVYCSLSAWPTVKAAFHNAGVADPHWWVAAYPGNGPNLYPGSVAHQYANPGPVDISVVADYWPGVDHISASPASPFPTTAPPIPEDDMLTPEAQTWIEGRLDAHSLWVTQNLRAAIAASDPAALAAAVAKAMPATSGTVTQAQLEAALRVVLGSVDGKV